MITQGEYKQYRVMYNVLDGHPLRVEYKQMGHQRIVQMITLFLIFILSDHPVQSPGHPIAYFASDDHPAHSVNHPIACMHFI